MYKFNLLFKSLILTLFLLIFIRGEAASLNQDYAIFISFSKIKASIGKNDSSAVAMLARKYGLENKSWPVGHTGIILIDAKTGNTIYTDFGRYGKRKRGMAVTRYMMSDMQTVKARFDSNGVLDNAGEIVKSLFVEGSYFQRNKRYGKSVVYSTVGNLNFEKMDSFSKNHGRVTYGFGEGKSYCTKFATDVLEVGGAKLKKWDMNALSDNAANLIKEKGVLRSFGKIIRMVKSGPTGDNVAASIKQNNEDSTYSKFRFIKNKGVKRAVAKFTRNKKKKHKRMYSFR